MQTSPLNVRIGLRRLSQSDPDLIGVGYLLKYALARAICDPVNQYWFVFMHISYVERKRRLSKNTRPGEHTLEKIDIPLRLALVLNSRFVNSYTIYRWTLHL